jgi:[ribosomal protein S5]-alanine N-acetyltransferase
MKQKVDFILRPWNLEDLDNLVRFANNKKIADNLTDAFPHPYSREHGIAYIKNFSEDNPARIFAIEVEGIACGSIGIFPQADVHRKNAEMGYWLAEDYWGRGIMTAAVRQIIAYGFKTFDINRIFARPYSYNLASQRVLAKAGMKLEGRFEKALFKNGQFIDELIYSILKPES